MRRVRVWTRPDRGSNGAEADAPFFEDRPPPPRPARPVFTAREEAESLARWQQARRRQAKPDAPTAREMSTLGFFAAALLGLGAAERAGRFDGEAAADGVAQAAAAGGGAGRIPDAPEEVATAAASRSWTPSFAAGGIEGAGATILGPFRVVLGSGGFASGDVVGRAEAAAFRAAPGQAAEAVAPRRAEAPAGAEPIILAAAEAPGLREAGSPPPEFREARAASPNPEARPVPADAGRTAEPATRVPAETAAKEVVAARDEPAARNAEARQEEAGAARSVAPAGPAAREELSGWTDVTWNWTPPRGEVVTEAVLTTPLEGGLTGGRAAEGPAKDAVGSVARDATPARDVAGASNSGRSNAEGRDADAGRDSGAAQPPAGAGRADRGRDDDARDKAGAPAADAAPDGKGAPVTPEAAEAPAKLPEVAAGPGTSPPAGGTAGPGKGASVIVEAVADGPSGRGADLPKVVEAVVKTPASSEGKGNAVADAGAPGLGKGVAEAVEAVVKTPVAAEAAAPVVQPAEAELPVAGPPSGTVAQPLEARPPKEVAAPAPWPQPGTPPAEVATGGPPAAAVETPVASAPEAGGGAKAGDAKDPPGLERAPGQIAKRGDGAGDEAVAAKGPPAATPAQADAGPPAEAVAQPPQPATPPAEAVASAPVGTEAQTVAVAPPAPVETGGGAKGGNGKEPPGLDRAPGQLAARGDVEAPGSAKPGGPPRGKDAEAEGTADGVPAIAAALREILGAPRKASPDSGDGEMPILLATAEADPAPAMTLPAEEQPVAFVTLPAVAAGQADAIL